MTKTDTTDTAAASQLSQRPSVLQTPHGPLPLPAFLPDGTRGVVRTLDAGDLVAGGIRAVMVNVLHLSSHPGTSVVGRLGGIHRFMGFDGPIASDSGGFQAYSLVSGSRKLGSISDKGFTYRLDKAQDKKILTPEKCIQRQFQLGSDIMFCLDHCTHPSEEPEEQRRSVEHTAAWARRCREEFETRNARARSADSAGASQVLFAVVQGGSDRDLRRECAERLLDTGCDGYGFGGWPIDDAGALVEMVHYVAELIPPRYPLHALGIGKPENVVRAFECGYRIFDCAMPTRDARHKRLFAFNRQAGAISGRDLDFYHCLYLQDERHERDAAPVEDGCDCLCCRRYSRGYLYHLFNVNEQLAMRLATIHNLRFYTRLMERLGGRHDGAAA